MGFLDLHLKLKIYRLRRLLHGGEGRSKLSRNGIGSRMMPVSHGHRSVENRPFEAEPDLVVAEREQIQENELWLFGIFDGRIGDGVSKYIEANMFDQKIFKQRKSKETLRKAHLSVRAKIRAAENSEQRLKLSSATAVVINGEKLLVANMGDYKAVLCRNGRAYKIRQKQGGSKRPWFRKFFQGVFHRLKVRLRLGLRGYGKARVMKLASKSSEIVVGSHRIDTKTEFLILGNIGIWEVMKYQEAVSLIRHIQNPQEAAEWLAREALTRMSRNIISCLIIRFD